METSTGFYRLVFQLDREPVNETIHIRFDSTLLRLTASDEWM